jgi:transposase
MVIPAGVQVHLALGYTYMRKGLDGLATLIQEHLKKDPFSGHLFVFRGKNASLLKILLGKGAVVLAACWSHTRRRFYEVAQATNAPIATEALRRIAELYG